MWQAGFQIHNTSHNKVIYNNIQTMAGENGYYIIWFEYAFLFGELH